MNQPVSRRSAFLTAIAAVLGSTAALTAMTTEAEAKRGGRGWGADAAGPWAAAASAAGTSAAARAGGAGSETTGRVFVATVAIRCGLQGRLSSSCKGEAGWGSWRLRIKRCGGPLPALPLQGREVRRFSCPGRSSSSRASPAAAHGSGPRVPRCRSAAERHRGRLASPAARRSGGNNRRSRIPARRCRSAAAVPRSAACPSVHPGW